MEDFLKKYLIIKHINFNKNKRALTLKYNPQILFLLSINFNSFFTKRESKIRAIKTNTFDSY